jgi:hypothetical protein
MTPNTNTNILLAVKIAFWVAIFIDTLLTRNESSYFYFIMFSFLLVDAYAIKSIFQMSNQERY